jgi:hypothetical protein
MGQGKAGTVLIFILVFTHILEIRGARQSRQLRVTNLPLPPRRTRRRPYRASFAKGEHD